MLAGMKRQELYMGPTQTSINVRDLSPETEYEISLFALKGLTPSEPIMAMEKTQPVKVLTGELMKHMSLFIFINFSECALTHHMLFNHGRHIVKD